MQVQSVPCDDCGTQLAPGLNACPGCGQLPHRRELETLRTRAQEHLQRGAPGEALSTFRRMLELLPRGSKQFATIEAQVRSLSTHIDAAGGANSSAAAQSTQAPRWLAGLGGLGLVLWKAKWLVAALLGKGKFLLVGLTKVKTLLTMFLSVGVYWTLWGWRFAVGLVISMYAHEMGHVAALNRFGVRASAPMFVPGLGALVRLEQRLASPVEEARTGMAGPIWGTAAALVCYAIYRAFDAPLFGALAGFGAWLNLFNLLPVWQLDGSRAFAALSRGDRMWCAVASLACALYADDIVLYGVALFAGLRAWSSHQASDSADAVSTASDRRTLLEFIGTVGILSALLMATRSVRGN